MGTQLNFAVIKDVLKFRKLTENVDARYIWKSMHMIYVG